MDQQVLINSPAGRDEAVASLIVFYLPAVGDDKTDVLQQLSTGRQDSIAGVNFLVNGRSQTVAGLKQLILSIEQVQQSSFANVILLAIGVYCLAAGFLMD